jgi:catechol 2,3-dioxygenase-like lactoylglutathione lyase family enzyme
VLQLLPISLTQRQFYRTIEISGVNLRWQHVVRSYEFPFKLDMVTVESVLAAIQRRHPILTSRLAHRPAGDFGLAIDSSDHSVPLKCQTLTGADPAAVNALASSFADQEFDLFLQAPYRVLQVSVTQNLSIIVFVFSHIFNDGFGADIVVNEFLHLYGDDRPQARPAATFFDYIEKEQSLLDSGDYAAALAAIDASLGSAGALLEFDRPFSQGAPFRVSSLRFGDDQCVRLDGKTRQARITAPTLILAAISVGILTVTGQRPSVAQIVHDLRRDRFFETVGQFADYVFVRLPDGIPVLQDAYLAALCHSLERAMDYALPSEYFASNTRLDWCRERYANGFQCSDIILNYFSASKSPARAPVSRSNRHAGEVAQRLPFRPYELYYRNESVENFTGVILEVVAIRFNESLDIRFKWACDVVPESKQRDMEEGIISSLLSYVGPSSA